MQVFCKLEQLQRTGSFKERGARNALLLVPQEQRARGVIAASAGNHALGLAYHGRALGIPVTVHTAIGAEIIHQHPTADGAAIGTTSHRDFRRLAGALADLDDGGVVLNLGSAVMMPEVFLKALTIARNLNGGRRNAKPLRQIRPRDLFRLFGLNHLNARERQFGLCARVIGTWP